MEKVLMGLGILFITLSAILFIAFVISIICDSFEKKSIAQRRAEAMQRVPMRIVEVSNQDTIRTLRAELSTYKNAYGALLQEMRKKQELVVPHKLWCDNCKHSIKDEELMICEKRITCKLYEKK